MTPGLRADGEGQKLRSNDRLAQMVSQESSALRVALLLEELHSRHEGRQENHFSENGACSRKQTHREHAPELTFHRLSDTHCSRALPL